MQQPEPSQSNDVADSSASVAPHVQLFNEVLEATLIARRRDLTPDEWRLLRIASPNELDELKATIAIVDVFLLTRFATLACKVHVREKMSQQIAATILADPYARTRMAEFRKHLSETMT